MAQFMTMAEYAESRELSHEAVRKAVKTGRIELLDIGGKRLLHPELADAQWRARTRGGGKLQAALPPAAADQADDGESLEELRRRELHARTIKAEHEAGRLTGDLVLKDDVVRAATDQGLRLMEELRSIPDRIAHQLHSAATPEAARRMLVDELDRAVRQFREGFNLPEPPSPRKAAEKAASDVPTGDDR